MIFSNRMNNNRQSSVVRGKPNKPYNPENIEQPTSNAQLPTKIKELIIRSQSLYPHPSLFRSKLEVGRWKFDVLRF